MAEVTLPDGNTLEIADGATAKQLAEQIGPGLAKAAAAVKINGRLLDLSAPISGEAAVQIITLKDAEGLEVMRHSCAHVMAEAISIIRPKTKLVYGPTVEDGFYYDIDLDEPIRPSDFEHIEQKMREITKADTPIVRKEMTKAEALEKLAGDKYKTDNINRAEGDVVSFYSHGDGFEDLCRGPHVPSTGRVGNFKIMSVAGAYWHGDPTAKMLQRVYGTAWPSKKELDDYLHRLEEAKKRDHRVLGKQLDLFSFNEAGPGFAFMHAKGMIIWNAIVEFWRRVHDKYGYREIQTPIILNEELWHKSGHWEFEDFRIELSTKPAKHIGSDEIWETATRALEDALAHKHIDYKINAGDGAFYGPKIDFHIRDCLKRSWQLGTIQLDFSMPERFGLVYTDKDNTEKTPVMIHRAVLGSFERFIGILIEHYGGSFPLWLAPEQVRILPISEKTNDYAKAVEDRLKDADMRCSCDLSDEKIGAKIAKAHAQKLPYMLVVGPREAESGSVNVRIRAVKENETTDIDEFLRTAKQKIRDKEIDLALSG